MGVPVCLSCCSQKKLNAIKLRLYKCYKMQVIFHCNCHQPFGWIFVQNNKKGKGKECWKPNARV